MMPLVQLHLDQLQPKARTRLLNGGQAAFIRKKCKQIVTKLERRSGTAPIDTPGQRKQKWAESHLPAIKALPPLPQASPWTDPLAEHVKATDNYWASTRLVKKNIKKHFANVWQTRWAAYQGALWDDPVIAQSEPLTKKSRLKLHKDLTKAESALAVQIRSEKIAFAQFLYNRRVPTVLSAECDCGWESQTAKHVIFFCPLRTGRACLLAEAETNNYKQLPATCKGLKIATKWLMNQNMLTQFSLATQTLYQG